MTQEEVIRGIMQYHGFDYNLSEKDLRKALLSQTKSSQIPAHFVAELEPTKRGYERRAGRLDLRKEDHIEAMVLSMLSSQRDFGPVGRAAGTIKTIFNNFDATLLKCEDPNRLIYELTSRGLGNRQIHGQMENLKHNIEALERIEFENGSIDTYYDSIITTSGIEKLVRIIVKKFKYLGVSLACEYLKAIGIDVCKPDQHMVRFISADRMNWDSGIKWTKNPSDRDKYRTIVCIDNISRNVGFPNSFLDAIIWNFCNSERGICGESPKGSGCPIKAACNIKSRCC